MMVLAIGIEHALDVAGALKRRGIYLSATVNLGTARTDSVVLGISGPSS
jgi:hypothetical protein